MLVVFATGCPGDDSGSGTTTGEDTDASTGSMDTNPPTTGVTNDDSGTSGVDDTTGDTGTPVTCVNGVLDDDETDVDCGGTTCDPCADGQACVLPTDCVSGECVDQVCLAPVCGDGVIAGEEECDDMVETVACDTDCTVAECGDGVLNVTFGEECDEGPESLTCDSDCTPAACGDGLVNATAGEACDEGGEQTATCEADCTAATCGDGVFNLLAGEECDDGDAIDDNACSNMCTRTPCVFDTTLLPIAVHSSYAVGEIDFDGDCNVVVSGGIPTPPLYRVDAVTGAVSELVADFAGAVSQIGVAYRVSDDLTYVTTDMPTELWSVASDGTAVQIMALPTTITAIEVAPIGFGTVANQIVGTGLDGSVYAFDPATMATTVLGTTTGQLSDLAFDAATSTVYIAAHEDDEVRSMSAAGVFSVVAGGFSGPDGITLDPAGTIYFAESSVNALTSMNFMGGGQTVLANPDFNSGAYVTGLLLDGGGSLLYVSAVGGQATLDFITP
jgi:cysteine-rich repeat protein